MFQLFFSSSRIVLLHVVIIAGGAPVIMMGSPLPLLVLLVAGKIVLDAVLHLREHRESGRPARSY